VITFIENLGGIVSLLGHSRGGEIAFRVAQRRPDLLRKLILAEPGGELDESLAQKLSDSEWYEYYLSQAAARICIGNVDGGLGIFINQDEAPGLWERLPASAKQLLRDYAHTLVLQAREKRRPYTMQNMLGIRVPTLFTGSANTAGRLAQILGILSAHTEGSRQEIVPNSSHLMFHDNPDHFSDVVLDFLATS
jgi:pimeloyl-ACP methyl ester carboxylesterase